MEADLLAVKLCNKLIYFAVENTVNQKTNLKLDSILFLNH